VIQVAGDGAPRDAELAHEVPAVGQAAGFRASRTIWTMRRMR
jgi:hypothetical protein